MPAEAPIPHRTEAAYDAEIAPLVNQIIKVCKRENLPLLIHVALMLPDGDDYAPGGCITLVPGSYPAGSRNTTGYANRHGLCAAILQGDSRFDTTATLRITSHHEGLEPEVIGLPAEAPCSTR